MTVPARLRNRTTRPGVATTGLEQEKDIMAEEAKVEEEEAEMPGGETDRAPISEEQQPRLKSTPLAYRRGTPVQRSHGQHQAAKNLRVWSL